MSQAREFERSVLSDIKQRTDARVEASAAAGWSMLKAVRQPEGKLLVRYLRPKLKILIVIGAANLVSSGLEAARLLFLLVTLKLIVGETGATEGGGNPLGLGLDFPFLQDLEGTNGLFIALAGLGAATLVKEGTDLGVNYLSARVQSHFMFEVRRDLLDKLLALESRYFTDTKSGDIAYLQNTVVGRFAVLVPTIRIYLQAALDLIVALVILMLISVPLTLMLIVLAAGFLGLSSLLRRRARKLSFESEDASRQSATYFLETVHGIRLVKLGGQHHRVRTHFLGLAWTSATTLVRQMIYEGFTGAVSRVGGIVVVLVLAVGLSVFASFEPGVNAGLALGFLTVSLRATMNITNVIQAQLRLALMVPHFLMIAEFLLDPRYVEESALRQMPAVPPVQKGLAAEGVSFSYTEGRPVLDDVSLELPRGTITALVGPSGSGKTTLLELLAGFRNPESGRILVDGTDLAEHDLSSYRSQIGYVTQEMVIFHDTLRSNVAFLKPDATQEEIDRALELAEAREFVGEHGLDAVVGERGGKISGGQRQRIALSRVLLQDPPVVLLDEATNALDLETESRVFDNLLRSRQDKVVVVAAHRLSALTRFDNIAVLHQGRIVEQGTHAQLLAMRGFYYHLFGLQEFAPDADLDSLAQL